MKKIVLITLVLNSFFYRSFSQEAANNCEAAKRFFETFKGACKSAISAHNCVHLDITDSYDFEGKEFRFEWEMGDGTYLEGMEVNHCYESAGRYTAKLKLVDPVTKVSIEEEAQVTVLIKGAFSLSLDIPEQVETNKVASFANEVVFPEETYELDAYYWHFGDGTFSCSKNPSHKFTTSGNYKVDLLVKLSSEMDQEILCMNDTITVKMPDPSRGLLTDLFTKGNVESRYLNDEVHYKILSRMADEYVEMKDRTSLPGGKFYKLLAYSGSMIFEAPEISTEANASNNAVVDTLNAQAIQLAESKPLRFTSIFFELDQDNLSKKNKKIIKENIEILETLPMLKIGIGVYTNSRGSLAKGVELSMYRGNLIKDYMVENGVDSTRIVVVSPNDNRSLINSCVTGSSCDYADPALDRRADFKILNELLL